MTSLESVTKMIGHPDSEDHVQQGWNTHSCELPLREAQLSQDENMWYWCIV